MWQGANLQSSCVPHHSVVKQRLEVMVAKCEATLADLRLDSALAIVLTRELLR
jgi:hypothetical protein